VYAECPLKAKLKFIDKLQEPSSPALERGTVLHKQCEDFLLGRIKTVTKETKPIAAQLKDLKKRGALAEAEFAFDVDWRPVSWFDRSAWCRVKADAVVAPVVDTKSPVVEVHDFKSGGKLDTSGSVLSNDAYPVQLRLYALAGLLTYPVAEKAQTSLIFIDHGKTVPMEDEFKRKDVKLLQKEWVVRTKKMLNDTVFKPTPGNGCRYCFFSKARGGQCPY
jgi:CRISPR/Cas system-associated exonuclease Cas4 (RecB family)